MRVNDKPISTSVLIDADIKEVWESVVAFPEITAPAKGGFRLGIAYPIEARIEGDDFKKIKPDERFSKIILDR